MILREVILKEHTKVSSEIQTGLIPPERFVDYARAGITDIKEYKKQLDELLKTI